MKKTNIVMMILAGLGYLMMTSYRTGPAAHGWDCTGAETGLQNPAGCGNGSGCHSTSATSAITLSLEMDSAGVPTTHYIPGTAYTIKLSGVNTSSTTFTKFGFQIGCIDGSTAVTTPMNAGMFHAPYPTGTHYVAPSAGNFVVGVVEQSTTISPTTGAGGSGSTFVESFSWTAPAAGTGTISFWGVMNLVNFNGNADAGDKWNTTHIVIDEETTTGIETIQNDDQSKIEVNNPIQNQTLFLNMETKRSASMKVDLYSLNGQFLQCIYNENMQSGKIQSTIHLANATAPGTYILHFQSGTDVLNKKIIIID